MVEGRYIFLYSILKDLAIREHIPCVAYVFYPITHESGGSRIDVVYFTLILYSVCTILITGVMAGMSVRSTWLIYFSFITICWTIFIPHCFLLDPVQIGLHT